MEVGTRELPRWVGIDFMDRPGSTEEAPIRKG